MPQQVSLGAAVMYSNVHVDAYGVPPIFWCSKYTAQSVTLPHTVIGITTCPVLEYCVSPAFL